MRLRWALALLAGVAAVGLYAGNLLATPQIGVTTTQLAKGTYDHIYFGLDTRSVRPNGPSDVYVVQNTFAPGSTTGWHTHPGPSLIMVTSGQVTAYEDDRTCTPRVYKAGQSFSFVDPGGGDVHMLRNETTAPAQTVAVSFIPKDAPRRIDRAATGNCGF